MLGPGNHSCAWDCPALNVSLVPTYLCGNLQHSMIVIELCPCVSSRHSLYYPCNTVAYASWWRWQSMIANGNVPVHNHASKALRGINVCPAMHLSSICKAFHPGRGLLVQRPAFPQAAAAALSSHITDCRSWIHCSFKACKKASMNL